MNAYWLIKSGACYSRADWAGGVVTSLRCTSQGDAHVGHVPAPAVGLACAFELESATSYFCLSIVYLLRMSGNCMMQLVTKDW
jgi:hypothetical protein